MPFGTWPFFTLQFDRLSLNVILPPMTEPNPNDFTLSLTLTLSLTITPNDLTLSLTLTESLQWGQYIYMFRAWETVTWETATI